MTATAILLLCLQAARREGRLLHPQPHRRRLRPQPRRAAHDRGRQGGDVVVTVDCGITSVAEAETARELGLTLIITDHHRAGRAELAADARARIVHPGLPGSTVSIRRPVRRRRRAEARLGALPASERGEARRRGDANVLDASRRPGRDRHGGRRRAARRRKPHPRPPRPQLPAPLSHARPAGTRAGDRPRQETTHRLRGHRLHDRPAAQRGRPAGPGAARRRAAHDRIARAGPQAGRVHPRPQRAAANAGAERVPRRQQARPAKSCDPTAIAGPGARPAAAGTRA